MTKKYFAHSSAYIDEPVSIGSGTKIWHHVHIMPNARIGKNCMLGQNVFVGAGVQIGNNVRIQNNVSVYEGVILEDDVFCGPSMVFTNVKMPRSAFPLTTTGDYDITRVKRGATLGANSTIICGTTVGSNALIGAAAVVTKDIPDNAVAYGNPAKISGWICPCGKVISENKDDIFKCKCNRDAR